MNIIEYARKHSGALKVIVTVGFLAGLAILSYSSAYSSYTGVTSPVENAYALKQKQATVCYTKEPQRVLIWNSYPRPGSLVGRRDSSDKDAVFMDTHMTKSYVGESTPLGSSSGKVSRITADSGYSSAQGGRYTYPYWTTSSGSVQRYLTPGKQYVLMCYAKGKGNWIIGDEQDKQNRNAGNTPRTYTLNENSWTKVEQVFTAAGDGYRAFVQYLVDGQTGDYCDVSDVFVAEVLSTQTRDALSPVGTVADGSSILGFKGWTSSPDRCGVGYDSSDADFSTSDTVPIEGKVYYPVVKRYAIDVNADISGTFDVGDIPANITLRINGIAVANNRHGDIFTSAPEGSTYSFAVNSTDSGYRYRGLGTTGASYSSDAQQYRLIGFGTSVKGSGSMPAVSATSGTVSGDMSFCLMFTRVYKITWNLDGGNGTYETSYESTDNDYTVTPPSKSGYGFAGWTGTGLNAATVNLVIPKGSTGDREYTAHWGSTPIEVSCQGWTEDANGNPYKRLACNYKTLYAVWG